MRFVPWLRGESGFSIVPAIATLALLIMLGGVAVKEAVSALGQSNHQRAVKRALQGADSAIDAAVYRLNSGDVPGGINIDPLNPGAIVGQTCIVRSGEVAALDLVPLPPDSPLDPSGRRWCPATEPEIAADGTSWSYRVSELLRTGAESCNGNGILSLDREIVAVGQAGRVRRRVHARLRAAVALLSGAAVQSASDSAPLVMSDAARVLGDVQSNHDINGAATNVIAGSAIPGPGRSVTGVVPVGSNAPACSEFVLPPIDAGDSATNNHNTQRTDGCVDALFQDALCLGLGGVDYDAEQETLRVWGTGRTILDGSTYSFCKITLEGSGALVVPPTKPVTRIFLRDPASCPSVPDAGQLAMDGTARIVNCHPVTRPETLQVYALGAGPQSLAGAGTLSDAAMAIACGGNLQVTGVPMVLYAPHSHVHLGGTVAIAGQVAGATVQMSGAAAVEPINALVNLDQLGGNPILPLYQPVDYIECTSRGFAELPAADPAQGC